MPTGDAFTTSQRHDIDRALADAKRMSTVTFSVYVGATEGQTRSYAESLHAQLDASDDAVLVFVDPGRRRLEIVTGVTVSRILDSRQAALAAATMQSAFQTGDLARGIIAGVQQLASSARSPQMLHTDTP